MERFEPTWAHFQPVDPRRYRCGHCDANVGSERGIQTNTNLNGQQAGQVVLCMVCNRPSVFVVEGDTTVQAPAPAPGESVAHVPDDVDKLYREARKASGAGAHTAAVLALRKLLMHVAVDLGAPPGKSFFSYVEYLAESTYIPANARGWVDHVRVRGNEANHEIVVMGSDDAEGMITLAGMLLKIAYEFPRRVPGMDSPVEP